MLDNKMLNNIYTFLYMMLDLVIFFDEKYADFSFKFLLVFFNNNQKL